MSKDNGINPFYEKLAQSNTYTKSCDDVDNNFDGIKYYYDMLSGIGISNNVIKSRNIRIYRKMPKSKTNYFVMAFPYFDTTSIQISTHYQKADASWAERFFMGWKSGQKEFGKFINQSADLVRTIVDLLGVSNVNIDDIQSKLLNATKDKNGDDGLGTTAGRSSYVKTFESTEINITEGLSDKSTILLSSDSLTGMLNERIKNYYPIEECMMHRDKFLDCLSKNQPVRAYLFFLLDHLGGSVKVDAKKNIATQKGQFGFSTLDSSGINLDNKWDADEKVLYAVCGDAYVVKNLACTSLRIQPSNLLTPSGDYYSATISASFEPLRLGTSEDLTQWLTYSPIVGGKNGYFEKGSTENF